jgi:dTDP-4-amino-4,6-dideoxygalactose transaminase
MLDLRRQNAPIERELSEAFDRVLRSGAYILGEEVERFERDAAAVAGARYAIGVSSGTDALLVALLALNIGPGDEVICPSFTFFATGSSVSRVGAKPVFADCLPDSFNLDPAGVEALITPRTKAIIPVHLFGQPADMQEILGIASRHGLKVIEDAAQSFGAGYGGCKVGALGDCGTVSFYPSKNLGAFGDAGLVVTNDASVAQRARLVRNHGAERQYFHAIIGGNFRLDAVQGALLAVKLPLLESYTVARQKHAAAYNCMLQHVAGHIVLPVALPGRTHIMNQYTLRVPGKRDALRAFLQERGIATAIYYPVPLHRQECFRDVDDGRALPVSEALAAEVVSLPVFPEMLPEEQAAVAESIVEFFRR